MEKKTDSLVVLTLINKSTAVQPAYPEIDLKCRQLLLKQPNFDQSMAGFSCSGKQMGT